ncbi:MAG: GNAT family N-acetyltransferase [Bacteroidota bacterium]
MTDNYWKGDKVRLRALEPEDWEVFYTWNQESYTQRNLDRIWFPGSKEMVRDWARKKTLQKGEKDEFFFVIEENRTGEIAGSINSHDCDKDNGTFGYGLGIIASHRQKGYASEAILLVLRYFFQELRYNKVTVGIYAHNEPSQKLHERLGFQEEGRLRSMIYQHGQYWDLVHMGMLGEEFEAKYGGGIPSLFQ